MSEESEKHSTDLHFMAKTACSKAKEHGKEFGADASPEITVPKSPTKSGEKVISPSDLHFMSKTACSKAKEHEKANESVIISEITITKRPIKIEEKPKACRSLNFMTKTACSKAKEHGKIDESGAGVKIAVPKSPVKSEDRDKSSPSLHFMSKTTCFKAKEHGKASPDTPRVRERSPAKRTVIEEKGIEKHVRIATEHKRTFKESREYSASRSSRSVSRERTANHSIKSSTRSPAVKPSVSKKSLPKSENKPTSVIKSTLHSSNIQKPTQSSTAKTHAKHLDEQQSSLSEKAKGVSSNETTVEFEMKSESRSSTVEMIGKVLSNGIAMSGKLLNGENNFSRGNRIESDLLNDSKLENLLNELNLESEMANAMTTIESLSMKNVSKIPRKKGGSQSDIKICSTDNQKKSTNTQPHGFENGIIENVKKETIVSEMNAVHITNVN